jgi:hypothetical protein
MEVVPQIHMIAPIPASIHSRMRFMVCLLNFPKLKVKKFTSLHFHSTNRKAPSQLLHKTIYGLIKDHKELILEFWDGITSEFRPAFLPIAAAWARDEQLSFFNI